MVREISIEEFYKTKLPLIDVRSPGEYVKGHIPGAVNIPLFSDAERAHVGTVYVRNSKEKATEIAYSYINPKLDDFITQSRIVAPCGKAVIHCWRGGMRSHSFALHLTNNGFSDVDVINGGYKAYRNYVLNSFSSPFDLRIVGGYTGSGKTQVIKYLQHLGHQAVDLESLASHKGSAFGGIGQAEQPSTEQFENNLFEKWQQLDHTRPIWLEDESRNIGGVNIPPGLFEQMLRSPLYFLDIPKEKRAMHLVGEYAGADPELLAGTLHQLTKRLGGQNTKDAIQFLNERKFYEVAMLTLHYYDKSYRKGMSYRNQNNISIIKVNHVDAIKNTDIIVKQANHYERNKTNTV